jgi:hypothetical protein
VTAVTVKKIAVADEEVVLTALRKVDGIDGTKKVRGLGNARNAKKRILFFASLTSVLLFRDSYFV